MLCIYAMEYYSANKKNEDIILNTVKVFTQAKYVGTSL
jgi:hypothetical protein